MLRRYLCCGAGVGDGEGRVADEPEPECEKVEGGGDAVRRFSWSEIEAATSGFTSPVIGEGGFSTVYLGRRLPGSPSPPAVKVHFSSGRLHIAFRRELDVLRRLRPHPNVVRLIGFSDDQEEGALVFEYAPNGSLHDKLHGGGGGGGILGWAERVSIARQVAGALDHLHERCGDLPVVHGDVKSANVVLGAGLEARLCDFGSAQLGFAAAVARPGRAAVVVVGSPGYVDPHYLRSGLLTKRSDAYSFGVLLLELVTGAEAFSAGGPLTAAIGPKLLRSAGGIGGLVDPRLGAEYDAEEAAEMVKLAAACVAGSPSLRPSMAEVVRAMEEKACKSISAVRARSNGMCDS